MPQDGARPVLIIDAKTLAVPSTADIEIGRHPAHVIDTLGKPAYVTNSKDDNVFVIDVAQKTLAADQDRQVSARSTHESEREGNLLAGVNDNSVSVIDTMNSIEVAYRPVG